MTCVQSSRLWPRRKCDWKWFRRCLTVVSITGWSSSSHADTMHSRIMDGKGRTVKVIREQIMSGIITTTNS